MSEKSGDEFRTHQCEFSGVPVFYLNPLVYTTKEIPLSDLSLIDDEQ